MQSLPPLAGEINRILRNLAGGGGAFSLMTVSTSSLPASALRALIEAAARPEDVVGSLVEGSAALLAIRAGKGGEIQTEQDFIDRLQPVMADLCEHRIGGRVTLWLRAVHRTVEEVAHAVDLINALYDAPALPFTVNAGSEPDEIALGGRVILFRPAQPIVEPFIDQAVRMPAALRILNDITLPRFHNN